MLSTEENNSNWMFGYGLLDSVPVPGGDFPSFQAHFQWHANDFTDTTGLRFFLVFPGHQRSFYFCLGFYEFHGHLCLKFGLY